MLNTGKKLDPRIVRSRLVLRDALMALISEVGYDAITVQHITDRAGLNRATFYLHYRDKQDLLSHIINDVLNELTHIPQDLQTGNTADTPRLFTYYFDHVAKHAAFYRVMLQEASVAPYVQQMQQHVEDIARRWLASEPLNAAQMLTPAELFVSFIGSAYFSVIKWWVTNGQPYSSAYMAAQLMRLTLGGVQREFGLSTVLSDLDAQLDQMQTAQEETKST